MFEITCHQGALIVTTKFIFSFLLVCSMKAHILNYMYAKNHQNLTEVRFFGSDVGLRCGSTLKRVQNECKYIENNRLYR